MRVLMPRGSIVGLLFSQRARITYIRSEKQGLMQHYPYYWQTDGADFVPAKNPTASGAYTSETIHRFIEGLTMEERELFVEAIYTIAQSTNTDTWVELFEDWRQNLWRVLKAYRGIDPKTAKLFIHVLNTFFRAALEAIEIPGYPIVRVDTRHNRRVSKGTPLRVAVRRRKPHAIRPL